MYDYNYFVFHPFVYLLYSKKDTILQKERKKKSIHCFVYNSASLSRASVVAGTLQSSLLHALPVCMHTNIHAHCDM